MQYTYIEIAMKERLSYKSRSRRTRSLGGCGTCRRRHVKCDQLRPVCLTCRAVGVECEGFPTEIRWISSMHSSTLEKEASPGGLNATTARRHLYTEESRASMSIALTTSLKENSVDASLAEIDSMSKDTQGPTAEDIAIGPFGVLHLDTVQPVTQRTDPPEDSVASCHQGPTDFLSAVNEQNANLQDDGITDFLTTVDPLLNFDDSLQWADLFELNFDNMLTPPDASRLPVALTSLGNSDYNRQPEANESDQTMPPVDIQREIVLSSSQHEPLTAPSTPHTVLEVLADAQVLLKHFRNHVIAQFSALPVGTKSPWDILNLSGAIQTLAEMTFLEAEKLKHATMANLYGVLACSAYHLSSNSSFVTAHSAEHWAQIAQQTMILGRDHLRESLKVEFQGANKAKYKHQLMAVLSMMLYSIISGQQNDARCYMLDAERLLRLRGLAKREISRKARLLHHVYTWFRIAGESTYVIHDYKGYAPIVDTLYVRHSQRRGSGNDVRATELSAGQKARLDDFLRIQPDQSDEDLDINEPKERNAALHDIHLEDSRDNSDTMYIQIYGIPETWLSLLSQTTRLANLIQAVNVSNHKSDMELSGALQNRAARLENMICSFASKTSAAAAERTPNDSMHRALNSALVIFFYRRIRNVNPWILQGHVEEVIRALQKFDEALAQGSSGGPGIVWPAFMAGCEAMDIIKRDALLHWIEEGGGKCGLYGFKVAKEIMMEVWKRRDDACAASSGCNKGRRTDGRKREAISQAQCSWVDVLRERNMWLMLC